MRVCILDSGVELDHPLVGTVQRSVAVTNVGDEITIADDDAGDLCGHGTACAGIIRSLAPECELTSVRVLGAGYTGSAKVLLAGLEWAIEQGFDIINLSLSTTKKQYVGRLHELADEAYFKRAMLIASAHNMPVESFPWRFASVVSVGSHESADPYVLYANPQSARRVLRARPQRRDRLARRRDDHRDREQLRDAACRGSLRAHPQQASRAHALPAEERAAPDRDERRGAGVSDLRAAVAAGVFGADDAFRALLQATVETARGIFHAKAASVLLLDEETDELVFEAVAGEGAGTLLGRRFPSSTGVAGWVLVTRQPLVVEDLTKDTRFSRDAAESTGYVPRGLMAVPLLADDTALGVLEVLDRPEGVPFTLAEMDLLGLFANQAAIALDAAAAGAARPGCARGRRRARRARALRRPPRAGGRRAARSRARAAPRARAASGLAIGPRKSPVSRAPSPYRGNSSVELVGQLVDVAVRLDLVAVLGLDLVGRFGIRAELVTVVAVGLDLVLRLLLRPGPTRPLIVRHRNPPCRSSCAPSARDTH